MTVAMNKNTNKRHHKNTNRLTRAKLLSRLINKRSSLWSPPGRQAPAHPCDCLEACGEAVPLFYRPPYILFGYYNTYDDAGCKNKNY
jgi:hypothetical protein